MVVKLNKNGRSLIGACNEKYKCCFQLNIEKLLKEMVTECSKITIKILAGKNIKPVDDCFKEDFDFSMKEILEQMTFLTVNFDYDLKIT